MQQRLLFNILSLQAGKGFLEFGFFSPILSCSPFGNTRRIGKLAPFSASAPFGLLILILI